jgi:hypothetical protein
MIRNDGYRQEEQIFFIKQITLHQLTSDILVTNIKTEMIGFSKLKLERKLKRF